MGTRKIKVELPEGVNVKNINLERFKKLPLLLLNHDFNEPWIGNALEVKLSKNNLSFKAHFHKKTTASESIDFLNKQGLITKGYPGGYYHKDKDGNIDKFELFEISICP